MIRKPKNVDVKTTLLVRIPYIVRDYLLEAIKRGIDTPRHPNNRYKADTVSRRISSMVLLSLEKNETLPRTSIDPFRAVNDTQTKLSLDTYVVGLPLGTPETVFLLKSSAHNSKRSLTVETYLRVLSTLSPTEIATMVSVVEEKENIEKVRISEFQKLALNYAVDVENTKRVQNESIFN